MQIELTDEYLASQGLSKTFPLRFWSKVNKTSTCWLWTGKPDKAGYGYVNRGNHRCIFAHRASWIITRGPIPFGLFVCHKCDVPLCVNPEHLFLGTQADNIRDMIAKGRMPVGERRYNAKLTQDVVDRIRQMKFVDGIRAKDIAAKTGVGSRQVGKILTGRSWRAPGASFALVGKAKGESHYAAKLCVEDVISIRRRAADGEALKRIAKEFGLDPASVSNICRRKSWKHVE